MDREFRGKRYTAMLYGLLLLLIFGGCAKKAMVSEQAMETPQETVVSRAEETIETAYVTPRDETIPQEGMVEELALKETETAIDRMKDVTGLGHVFFDFDRYNIRPDARQVLEKNARWLKDNQGISVIIEGHADERGTNEYNIALGERRARSVQKYLEALGINSSRIRIISYGEERPFCTESREPCWQQNRRGHFLQAD